LLVLGRGFLYWKLSVLVYELVLLLVVEWSKGVVEVAYQ
jgi:hypothetical protein